METHGNKQVLDALTHQYNKLEQEIKTKMELQAAMSLVRAHFEGLATGRTHYVPSRRWEDPDTDLTGLLVDFSGARNTLERIIRIAEAAEGKLLNATMVAKLLIDTGESRGKLDTVRREAGQILKRHPQYFVAVATGTYRFLGRDATVLMPPIGREFTGSTDALGLTQRASGWPSEGADDAELSFDPSMPTNGELNDDFEE